MNRQAIANGKQETVGVTDADVLEMLRLNPLAAAQLESIALRRLLAERDAELQSLKEKVPSGDH